MLSANQIAQASRLHAGGTPALPGKAMMAGAHV